jgi:DtxR family Mn-dependent transcriptional regulator
MPHHNNLSESEEMYLVTIRKICESCTDTPIPIPHLAQELDVLPVSVNQMVKKLTEAGLLEYQPYKGVELTEEGRKISTRILRHRRLWEVFLVRELKMVLDEAAELSCRLEHPISEDVAQRLSTFLGNPDVCYHGSPIYRGNGEKSNQEISLDQLKVGQQCHIIRVDTDQHSCSFLAEDGIHAGMDAVINAISSSGSILIETANGPSTCVSKQIAQNIYVEVTLE